ncbi:MAG: MBL fold metallo-hydrolase [Candidatus Pacebacteria bacterium]|jgi:L-ascorbate metabolism protein UlaG (beta-lactamase superfamily)|nr:MBL fold metallo-hydrolase [Candidatus Paceibacterota bacterium]MDD5721896.1 MBL fold metallo-hydrolase [Candidatus Paceibacterota bacterium]
MIIQWFGHSFFRLETKGKVIAIDPYSEEATGLKPSRFKADILLITHQHEDHNNKSVIMGEPFVLEGPGELEMGGIFIDGLQSFHDKERGQSRGENTIFVIKSEEIVVCHLGDLGEPQLREESLEKVGEADILLVPVGGNYTINYEEAISFINQIEPKIIIPMHYALPQLKIKLDPLDKFVKAIGKKPETVDKLIIRKNTLPEETKLIVLNKQ